MYIDFSTEKNYPIKFTLKKALNFFPAQNNFFFGLSNFCTNFTFGQETHAVFLHLHHTTTGYIATFLLCKKNYKTFFSLFRNIFFHLKYFYGILQAISENKTRKTLFIFTSIHFHKVSPCQVIDQHQTKTRPLSQALNE